MASWFVLLLLLIFNLCSLKVYCQYYRSANLSTSWKNNPSSYPITWTFIDGSSVRPILVLNRNGKPNFGFGFYRNGTTSTSFYLAILKIPLSRNSFFNMSNYPPVVLWTANRDHPVREDASLSLTANGNLELRDAHDNDTLIWSTNTSNVSVASMILINGGYLRLVSASTDMKWQSGDYPTDTWLPRQHINRDERLTSSVSMFNFSSGLFYLSIADDGVHINMKLDRPQLYHTFFSFHGGNASFGFGIGSLDYIRNSYVTYQANGEDFQYMRLEPDGHLRVYQLVDGYNNTFVSDLLRNDLFGNCANPTVCGNYGVCTDGECSCAKGNYFMNLSTTQASPGCAEVTPLSCQKTQLHTFLELEGTSLVDFNPQLFNTDVESCKMACLKNCSCKAAIFHYQDSKLRGNCSLPSQIFSLITIKKEVVGHNAFASIKVQKSEHKKISSLVKKLVISLLSSLFSIFVSGLCCYCYAMWRKTKNVSERGSRNPVVGEKREGDESSIQEFDVLKNFSYEELESATQTFHVCLGRGGFGTVFEGTLGNGMKVAVKQLRSDVHQGRREFLAEVRTLGSIHHFNLVKLVGYCTTGLKRLLVYEFMCNGSLDKWIFHQDQAQTLTWEIRRKIIVGIAEGLKYLHVHCNPNIAHFDVKPQNILLDKDFNVKIADFGLAKLIERDQSEVYSQLKGTRGYMAPELFRGKNISVNVDVYSFGIVILEIICAQKNLDCSDDEFLIDAVKKKVEEDQLSDLVDKCASMQSNVEAAVRMMEIAIWCLQPYFRRPSISMVAKVLEGSMAMEPITDYSFLSMEIHSDATLAKDDSATLLMASIISGPR